MIRMQPILNLFKSTPIREILLRACFRERERDSDAKKYNLNNFHVQFITGRFVTEQITV